MPTDRSLKITLCADKRTSTIDGMDKFTDDELEGIICILIKRLSAHYGIKELELANHICEMYEWDEKFLKDPETAGSPIKRMLEWREYLRSKRTDKKVVNIDDLRRKKND